MRQEVRAACPRCATGRVAVQTSTWPQGRSVWLDEPASCTHGCALAAEDVRRLLLAIFRDQAAQLPLALEEVPA